MSNLPALRESPRFSLTDMRDMAGALAESKLFGIQTPQQAYALMLIADAEGLHPASVAQDYDVIQGRPARKTHSVLARFQQAGGTVEWRDFTETKVSGTFSHPKGGSVLIEWTIDMAARAGLAGKDNWKKTPRAMLRARCIAEGVRATYPAALGGALVTEEADDLGPLTIDAATGQTVTAPPAGPKVARRAPAADRAPAPPAPAAEPAEPPAPPADDAAPPAPAAGGEDLVGLGEIAFLRNKASAVGVELDKVMADLGGLVLERLTKADFSTVKAHLRKLEG